MAMRGGGRRSAPTVAIVVALVLGAAALVIGAGPSRHGVAHTPVRPAVRVRWAGSAADARSVRFDLVLRLPGRGRLDRALAALEDPHSPRFGATIAPTRFGSRFGLSTVALGRSERMLAADGVRVVAGYPQRTALTVRATVATIRRLFGVSLDEWSAGAERFLAPGDAGGVPAPGDGPVQIPRALRTFVVGVTGSTTAPSFVAHDVALHGLDPATAASAYDVTALHAAGYEGQGQTIAVVSFSAYDPGDPVAFAQRTTLVVHSPRTSRSTAAPPTSPGRSRPTSTST